MIRVFIFRICKFRAENTNLSDVNFQNVGAFSIISHISFSIKTQHLLFDRDKDNTSPACKSSSSWLHSTQTRLIENLRPIL